tara:strand:+ start:153 stop:449 length:297 start_codon:yes stop_codon:yes gene_type:complete
MEEDYVLVNPSFAMNWNMVMNDIKYLSENRQLHEEIYIYRIWKMTFYSYGEAKKYTKIAIYVDGRTRMQIYTTRHIIRDTYNMGNSFLKKKEKCTIVF